MIGLEIPNIPTMLYVNHYHLRMRISLKFELLHYERRVKIIRGILATFSFGHSRLSFSSYNAR